MMTSWMRQAAAKKPSKPSKYRNVKTVLDGITFDSKAEARRYAELYLRLRAGELTTLGCQPSFVVAPGVRYIPDFICIDNLGSIWVEDVKSQATMTSTFKLKQKLFETAYPGIELRIINSKLCGR